MLINFEPSSYLGMAAHTSNTSSESGLLLALWTGNGAPGTSLLVASGEVVPLSESSKVLAVLFAFIYPKRHPDLEDMGFEDVSEVAEAAEKYEVYPAMNVCRKRMRCALSIPE